MPVPVPVPEKNPVTRGIGQTTTQAGAGLLRTKCFRGNLRGRGTSNNRFSIQPVTRSATPQPRTTPQNATAPEDHTTDGGGARSQRHPHPVLTGSLADHVLLSVQRVESRQDLEHDVERVRKLETATLDAIGK